MIQIIDTSSTIDISIHALHEESDQVGHGVLAAMAISIHALHEESDHSDAQHRAHRIAISIHALHEESDPDRGNGDRMSIQFQSTLSMRRATHAQGRVGRVSADFNPRSP